MSIKDLQIIDNVIRQLSCEDLSHGSGQFHDFGEPCPAIAQVVDAWERILNSEVEA